MTAPRGGGDALSRTLVELRKAAGLTGQQVAERTGFSPAKVSKHERGRYMPSVEDAEKYADAVGATTSQRRRLVALTRELRETNESRLVLLRPGSGGARRMQDRILRIEQQSGHVGTFSNTVVPGLLQTPEYMQVVYESAVSDPVEVGQAVAGRMGRQAEAAAAKGRTRYTQIFTEGALMWQVGSSAVMTRQIERLVEAATARPHFQVGVIPSSRAVRVFPASAFNVYDTRAVLLGTFTATALMTRQVDVKAYHRLFDQLTELADFGEAAVPTLQRIADQYRAMEMM